MRPNTPFPSSRTIVRVERYGRVSLERLGTLPRAVRVQLAKYGSYSDGRRWHIELLDPLTADAERAKFADSEVA